MVVRSSHHRKVGGIMADDGFWRFCDSYTYARRHNPVCKNKTVDEFYSADMQKLHEHLKPGDERFQDHFTTGLTLWNHARLGHPYVKVFPSMAMMLARTRIDIPVEHLTIPLPVFEVRFQKGGPHVLRETETSPPLRSILIAYDLSHVAEVMQFMTPGLREHGVEILDRTQNFSCSPILERLRPEPPVYERLHVVFEEGETVRRRICPRKRWRTPSAFGYNSSEEFGHSMLAIAVATCFFLANNHEYIPPDIHPRLIERFRKAKSAAQPEREENAVLKKSKELGYNGRVLGEKLNCRNRSSATLANVRPTRQAVLGKCDGHTSVQDICASTIWSP